jgi:hypothetical protein
MINLASFIILCVVAGLIVLFLLSWLTLIIISEIRLFKIQRAEIRKYYKQIDELNRGN